MERVYPEFTICQRLRDLYHMTDDPEIKLGLRVCVNMAKAMNRKLQEYKADWDKGFWDEQSRKPRY